MKRMHYKDMMPLSALVCSIWCLSSALTIAAMISVKNDLDNGILVTEEVALTDCQVKDLTKWDKLFTMLENSQMRENILIQSVDEIIKVELQTLREEMLQLAGDLGSTLVNSINIATSQITDQLDRSLTSKCFQALQQENSLEARKDTILEHSLLLSLNISDRLERLENALKQRAAGEEVQRNNAQSHCAETGANLASALQEIAQLSSTLQQTQKYVNQRFLPAGCDAAILFPMRSPKIYASVHPVDRTLEAFTFCVWVKATEALDRTIVFSYGTKRNPYEIQLSLSNQSSVLLVGGDKNKVSAEDVVESGQWSQLCGTWSSEEGKAELLVNGEIRAVSSDVAKGHTIPNRGIFQLGQEKNGCCVGGGFDESLAFSGKITGFNLWDRVLSNEEIDATRQENGCNIRGNVVGWGTTEIQPHGGAQYIQ
ncbi:pentraxin-related protein PTX3 [Spea bombifrons]|uniref:pentraxin-related protein PTX3 n=1 Tax=Spea bombifrons TaxID=233779 RepID=UPI00234A549D|nr:pentraxin-related protein PTX3 [Spea bombifrons]